MQLNRTKTAQFQTQNCQLTLREALAEFYTVNAHLFSPPTPETKWTALLAHHDVGHVFFGVNTNLLDEAAGDYWTLLGSDLTFKEYMDYASTPEGKALAKSIGPVNIVKGLFLSIPLFCKVLFRTRKMAKKWETKGYDKYMDMSLSEIRDIYKLRILEY